MGRLKIELGLTSEGERNDTCVVGRVASAAQPLGQAERFVPFTFSPPVFVLYAGFGQAQIGSAPLTHSANAKHLGSS